MVDGVSIVKRLLGVLLALAGLVPLALGTWFAIKLGPSGAARFDLAADSALPVLIAPDVLNRTDLPVRITVEGDAVVGVGLPSEVASLLGTAQHRRITGVELPGWTLRSTTTGSGAPKGLGEVELWRERSEVTGSGTLTVSQDTAPESVLIVPGDEPVRSVSLTWTRDTWFYQALVLAGAGALLSTVGVLMARRSAPVHEADPEPATARTLEEIHD